MSSPGPVILTDYYSYYTILSHISLTSPACSNCSNGPERGSPVRLLCYFHSHRLLQLLQRALAPAPVTTITTITTLWSIYEYWEGGM